MQIQLGESLSAPFRPWRPDDGQVFSDKSLVAFDTETTAIDQDHSWITPAYVLGAAYDGEQGVFIQRQHLRPFLKRHPNSRLIFHHATFDLAVIQLCVPDVDVYDRVDRHRVWDTELLHRLYTLGQAGHTSFGSGQSTLAHCVRRYLGWDLPKDTTDSRGNPVRISYGQWLNRRSQEIEPVYLDYLAKDVMATFLLFEELRRRLKNLLQRSSDAFGYVSATWLTDQAKRWGWQTHHIQLKAAIVLDAISKQGLDVDVTRRDELDAKLAVVAEEKRAVLRQTGYVPGTVGCQKALQEILKRLERQRPDVVFQRTEKGAYKTSEDALTELRGTPFIDALLDFKAVEKLRSTFLSKMGRQRLHPSFDVLKNTGRTSCFGEINAQNLPRDDRVRSCFVPPTDHVFIDADYATVELATLAQAMCTQFGTPSQMAKAINDGQDLHRLVAARVTGKGVADVTKEDRQKAKAINFGKPGGMGAGGLKRYAEASYGVKLTDEEVEALSDSWFELFPEMDTFLKNDRSGECWASFFQLTPESYFEHTGSRAFLDHPNNAGKERDPHPILGSMCGKVLRKLRPARRNGLPYEAGLIDYFWTQVETRLLDLPRETHQAIRDRQPSRLLYSRIRNVVDRAGVFTLTGRLRANATFCARHNTIFQGLAADGAKLALWALWRTGFSISNFIHDEFLVAVPCDSDLATEAGRVRQLMQNAMREVVPDVRVEVECQRMDRWCKDGEKVLNHVRPSSSATAEIRRTAA